MFTDMVGFTSLSQRNEALAMELLEEHRKLLRPFFVQHDGREVKTMGDSFLVEFTSALDAVRCAFDIQRSLREANSMRPSDKQVVLRVGVHLGDVIHSQDDVYGDAVNIASRIEPLAEPGGICITEQIYDQIKNKFELPLTRLGGKELKNVSDNVEVFKVRMPWEKEPETTSALSSHRIAVLPFVNMSPDPQDEYFADGLTEELIDRLCQVKGLEVIARTSVMGYKKKDTKAAEIGRELRAGALVEGSVRKAGKRIRVTAQLIDANTEGHLWSSKYDRDFHDIFAVQTDIAEQVASALEVQLLPSEKKAIEQKRTENVEAYTLHLKGRFYWNERSPDSVRKGMQYFEKATALDPSFALAVVGLADCYSILDDQGVIEPKEARGKIRSLLDRALETEKGLAEAHASLANLLMHEWDWAPAEAEFRNAIELNPNYATAHHWYSILLGFLNRKEEALDEINVAVRLDPLSPIVNVNVGMRLAEAGHVEEGIEQIRKTLTLEPNFGLAHVHLGSLLIHTSRFDEAIIEIKRAIEIQKGQVWPTSILGIAYAMKGDREKALGVLSEMEEMSKTPAYFPEAILGTLYFALGQKEKAYSILEREYVKRSSTLPYIRLFLVYEKMREDPRIGALLDKVFLRR
jgi:TolB-like protein/Flp pilus assembly protein TadD